MMFLKKLQKKDWEEVNFGQVKGWQCNDLLEFNNLKHLFTGKSNDLNLGKHQPTVFPEKSVDKNREVLCKSLDLSFESLVVLPIVHSDNVLVLEKNTKEVTESDAVVTNLINIPILITAADCVPVLLYCHEKRLVGLVHAGWKGTSKRIVEKAVIAMQENYLARPSQIIAAIGPAIGQKNYEVGEDVANLLIEACEADEIVNTEGLKPKVDLKLANYIQLEQAGVMKIFTSELDTALHHSLFYSQRIQGKRAGRQGLIACLV
ncbi:MAG: peptidoglycan editing factor PgeF [Candidatus Melainabacteria bacterium]|nr:peptidoglycan editing factor PgeF [Candidatus Melainabacteria bacterium]